MYVYNLVDILLWLFCLNVSVCMPSASANNDPSALVKNSADNAWNEPQIKHLQSTKLYSKKHSLVRTSVREMDLSQYAFALKFPCHVSLSCLLIIIHFTYLSSS